MIPLSTFRGFAYFAKDGGNKNTRLATVRFILRLTRTIRLFGFLRQNKVLF